MKKKMIKLVKKFVLYMIETFWNKVIALAMIFIGMLPVFIDKDATALVFISFIAVPMFFARTNWIE